MADIEMCRRRLGTEFAVLNERGATRQQKRKCRRSFGGEEVGMLSVARSALASTLRRKVQSGFLRAEGIVVGSS